MKKTILTMAVVTSILVACKTSKPGDTTSTKPTETKPKMDCGNPEPTYANDIKLIIATNCIKCHGEGGKGGYNLGNLDDLKRAGSSGDLVGVIKWSPGFAKMPAKAEKLDDKTIAKIECWVKGGMKI